MLNIIIFLIIIIEKMIIIICYVYIRAAGVGRLYLLSCVKKKSIRKMSNFSF